MKKLHLSLLFLLAVLTASSQKVYFVYIQAESGQAFFVKMNEKVNSSTGSGYIILSKLVDSTYSFSIGFPQNKFPEQNFSVTMGKKDHGYLLKNFGEKGWGLFDLQTLVVQMAITGKASIGTKPQMESKDVSAFTEILSRAADDPSLKERPVVVVVEKPEEKKADPVVQAVVKTEAPKMETKDPVVTKPVEVLDVAFVKKEESKPEIKETVVTKPAEANEAVAIKKDEPKPEVKEQVVAKAEGNDVVTVKKEEPRPEIKEPVVTKPVEANDEAVLKKEEAKPEVKEVVQLVEKPAEKKEEPVETKEEAYKASQVKKWAESSTTEGFGLVFIDGYANGTKDTIRLVIPNPKPVVTISKEEPTDDKQFIKTSDLPVKDVVPAEEKKAIVETPADPVVEKAVVKNNCKEVATGDDFVKLRKRMAATDTDDDMIAEAKKYYKLKCFSTWQVKNLGVLFLTDEGKYKFFDASYLFVTDMQAFATLQAELKDEYYAGRFKAMLRN